ncbi:MAG: SLAP domain-containing protein, partial [Lactobacillus apis]|nr:SLAP domain-containing protein [Lactobacillus apis]
KDHGEKVYNHLKYISDLSDSDKQSFREKVDRIVQTGSANIETVKSQSDILKIISTSQNSIDELDTNSVSSKFTEKENSDSKTLRKNSVNKIGSDSKAFSLNGSSPDNFTLPEANSTRKSKLIEKKLKHSAYFYNQEGKRANLLVAKRGSIVNTFGREMIKNREFYLTDNNLYIAAENFDPLKRILKKRSFLYDENGRRSGNSTLKKGTEVSTYGSPV